jgi:glutamate-5-semialdehyde dehydrogenase
LTTDEAERQSAFLALNAPFFGDGFTRWVDGQYALKRPELGLSNWENGRLLGRSGILSGDSVYTLRVRVSGHGNGIPKDR